MRASRGAHAIAALALAAMGCVLFVSPEPGGAHCVFRGQDGSCGACLVARCRAEIDQACFDDAVIGAIEECATANDDACGRVPQSPAGVCMASRCAALCYARTGSSVTHCTDSFVSPGLACACDVDGPPNDLACTDVTYPRTRCCAPSTWPGAALQCACNAVSCTPTSDGCICILTDNLDESSAQDCRGEHCCAVEDRCQCRPRACEGGEREVAVCNKGELACPHGTVEVPGCSIRR